MKHRTLISILLIIVGTGCFLGACAYVAYYGTHMVDIQTQWPTVPATISGVSGFIEDDDGYLSITVQFDYSVDDIDYSGKQTLLVVPTGVFYSQEDKDKVILKYSPGSIVPVYYEPQNHKQAVIDPKQVTNMPAVFWMVYLPLLVGGPVMIGSGITLLVKT